MQQQQIPRLNQIQSIRNYFNQESSNMNNNGYIDNVKAHGNARILSLNPYGCRPFDSSKMCMLKQAISRLNIDIILMNETNTKQTSTNISKIEQEIRYIERAPIIITADSKESETIPADYLPEGLLNVILSKYSSFIQRNKIAKGRLGNWIAFSMQHN